MKNNILEYIILYVMVACAALVIATLARIFAASMGFDGFTTFMVFIIVLAVLVVVYLSIHVVLQNLMLPWIGKCLSKTPYIRKKIESRQIPIIEESEEATVEETQKESEDEVEQEETKTDEFPDIPELLSLNDIRREQLKK